MKNLFLLIGLVIISSCNTDDNSTTGPQNTLIIKNIVQTFPSYTSTYFFDNTGRLDSLVLAYSSNHPTSYTYDAANNLTIEHAILGSQIKTSSLTYVDSNPSTITKNDLTTDFNTDVIINDNNISYRIEEYDSAIPGAADVNMSFETNALNKMTQHKVTFPEPIFGRETWTFTDFLYDDIGNLTNEYKTYSNGAAADLNTTYTYDTKKNPFAESMASHRLSYSIINSSKLIDSEKLIFLSPNNIKSMANSEEAFNYIYEYNSDDYPVLGNKINATTHEVVGIINYIYY